MPRAMLHKGDKKMSKTQLLPLRSAESREGDKCAYI